MVKPRHAVAYHFFNEEATRYSLYDNIRETYAGPPVHGHRSDGVEHHQGQDHRAYGRDDRRRLGRALRQKTTPAPKGATINLFEIHS